MVKPSEHRGRTAAGPTRHFELIPSWNELAQSDESGTLPDFTALRQACQEVVARRSYRNAAWVFSTSAYPMYSRRLFEVSGECLAIGPLSVAVGDLVCAFPGMTMPFVLRKIPASSPERFQLLGEVYVHGTLHDRKIDNPDDWHWIELE